MIYLGKGGKIPYLNKIEIVGKAEEVLEKYGNKKFPVDVEALCDRLGINIFPVPNLAKTFHIDAFISADFKTIYVDDREFESESHRYRFSVAHELGHFVLHRKYYPEGVENLEEWLKISHSIVNNYAEFQANYFAGSLLLPENELISFLNNAFRGSFVKNYYKASPSELGEILLKVRKHFKVSDQVLARRMRDAFPGIEN